jgi:hypothetical protein
MISIHEILNRQPGDYFLGVIELEGCNVVGIVDDPVGVSLGEVRLQYPLEFLLKPRDGGPETNVGYIIPEIGLPDERIIDGGSVDIHMGNSAFGKTYFSTLRSLMQGPPTIYYPQIIKRPGGGTPNGTR